MTRATAAANRIVDKLITVPEDLKDLEELAYERGALVRYASLGGAEAWMSYAGRKPGIITISNQITNDQRVRFSIAHELGHFEIHRSETSLNPCSKGALDYRRITNAKGDRELEASEFAAALLLPERFIEPIFREGEPSFELIRGVAEEFNTSLTATALRYLDFCKEPVAVVYSESGRIRWFEPTDDFSGLDIFVRVREDLDRLSSAAILSVDPNSNLVGSGWRTVGADAWLRPGNYRADAKIKEQSIIMPNYNAALTLLMIDEVIEPEDDFW